MNCREITDFLMDYLDKALPPEQEREFSSHLTDCPECVAFIKSYELTQTLAPCCCNACDEPHEEVPERLVQAILAARDAAATPSET